MAKRRAVADTSDDEASNGSHAKRAKTEEDDEIPVTVNGKGNKGKGKQPVSNSNMELDGDDAIGDESLDISSFTGNDPKKDEAFEAQHGKAIEDAVKDREKRRGVVAEMGIIESIEMHQFMCHPRLSFKFGPQVNFIIGHNGSGKSAVLTALTIALGGKAAFTGRGHGLKSFIREGQHTAEVTVGIKNQGEEAYRPDTYGERIFITRRFNKDGSSNYKIKSADGKIVSNKREELTAICDHMNIQVDNPMNVLTQDLARQFLSGASAADKYQFFLKGTQLTQLSEEYQTCYENIRKTSCTLVQKKEELPELEQAVKESELRNEQATKARKKQDELRELLRELAWAHVKTKEDELAKSWEEYNKAQRRLPKIQAQIDASEKKIEETTKLVQQCEEEKEALPSMDAIETEYRELKAQFNKLKDEIRECKADERNMNQQVTQISHEIENYEREIQKITESQGEEQTHRQQVQQKLEAANEECNKTKDDLDQARTNTARLTQLVDDAVKHGRSLDNAIAHLRTEVESATNNIAECHRFSQDQLGLFGRNLPEVFRMVQEERWAGQPPIGPLGLHVTLKESVWAPIMRIQLGSMMTSWVVTDNRDRQKLKNILERTGNQNIEVIITEVDLFDYSHGEPPAEVTTVLRVLEIKDEFIKRIFINRRRIERVILARTREDGDNTLIGLRGGGTAWCLDNTIALRYAEGGGSTNHMTPLRGSDPRHHMFTGGDRTADLRHWEESKRNAENRLLEANGELRKARDNHNDLRKQLDHSKSQENRFRARVNELEQTIVRLQGEVIADAPINVDFLEVSKATALENKQNLVKQFEDLVKRRMKMTDDSVVLNTKVENLNKQRENHSLREGHIKERIAAVLQSRVEEQKSKKHYENKLIEETRVVDQLNERAQLIQREFEAWSNKAEVVGERFEKPRKAETVQAKIDSINKVLAQHQREQGATPEEIAQELYRARTRLETHRLQLDEMNYLNDALRQALALRVSKWWTFRQFIALRTKYQFQHYLWNRGYYGKVIFDHSAGTLNIKVQTEDQAGTQKDKDPKSLSGGEKSYSTICLLLALWEAIQCPLRCLDEFDVFMDSVNRRISMKMMIDTANTSDKQYILITPQDMSYVAIGPTVRVHRMNDPERNQMRLNL